MRHILVIDDDPVVLAMARDFLENAGYRVSVAKDAIYSNDVIYGSDPPELILMDVMMPLMSGDKKVRALKRRDRSSNIPVLLISGKEVVKPRPLLMLNMAGNATVGLALVLFPLLLIHHLLS